MSVALYVLFLFVFKWHQSFHVVGNSHSKKKKAGVDMAESLANAPNTN